MAVAPGARAYIVGIGDDGLASLSENARKVVLEAELLVGTPRVLAMASAAPGRAVPIGADLDEVLRTIESEFESRKVVVLVGGDPLFYGVAQLLFDRLGRDRVEIIPHVSSMQLAFARVKEDWDEAYLGDTARHSLEQVLDRIRTAERAGLFTSEQWPAELVARAMVAAGIDYFHVHVCENLGTRNEVITSGSPAEIAEMQFSPLAVMVMVRRVGTPDRQRTGAIQRLFGNPDEYFRQSRPKRGLLTPAEVRTLALAELNLHADCVVWDVGAGSGSVSIEAARLASAGKVFAIEPDAEDGALIRSNAATFGVRNVEVVADRAPAAFENLPDPDAVFLGGLGRETTGVLAAAFSRLKAGGTLAVNVASLENVTAAASVLRDAGGNVSILLVNIARGIHQLETIRLEALNPSFLVSAVKA